METKMASDEPDHGLTLEDFEPHSSYPVCIPEDAEKRKQHLLEEAKLLDVKEAVDELNRNALEQGDEIEADDLAAFGKRMATLIYHGGLSPGNAKAKAADELLRTGGRTVKDVADLLGMSRGGLSKLTNNAAGNTADARRLRYMTFQEPMNLVFDEHLAAEPPADYETRYVLLETINPRTEPEEEGGVRPNPRVKPPEPMYCLVRERYAHGGAFDLSKEPDERTYGTFQGMDVTWFADEQEVIDYLYRDRYFSTEERAEFWHDHLELHGFEPVDDPRERIDPDVLMEEEEGRRY